MSWQDLLQSEELEFLTFPWVGGRVIRSQSRTWRLEDQAPGEYGWHRFSLGSRKAWWEGPSEAPGELLESQTTGYLIGDRLVSDGVSVPLDPAQLVTLSEKVHLVEPGLDKFARVEAGRAFENGPLIYVGPAFPLGPEDQVLEAYLDRTEIGHVAGVVPALDASFRFECWQRSEEDRRRREELARREREERERLEAERVAQLREQMGDATGRRALAVVDFDAAATAALAVAGAEFLDSRPSPQVNEMVVRYRYNQQRLECTCHRHTLRIIDAGVCLTDHDTGDKGDTFLTLESLPTVIAEAQRLDKLVVWRHG